MKSNAKLTVLAILNLNGPLLDEDLEALRKLIEATRREPGCLEYRAHLAQADDGSGRIMFQEVWKDMDAFENHMAMPHVQDFVPMMEKKLKSPTDLSMWEELA